MNTLDSAASVEALLADGWTHEPQVLCVVAPCCGFTFSAEHTDTDNGLRPGGYSCPLCEIRADERAQIAALLTENASVFDGYGTAEAMRKALTVMLTIRTTTQGASDV